MYKFSKFLGKKSVTFLIVLSFISSTFYIPIFAPTPKAEAQWAVIDVKQLAQWLMDHIGMAMAQALIDQMIDETIEWANTGFEGNPAYATDPEQFFTDIADGVAGEFIDKELGLDGLLCSPFEIQIRLGLANYHAPERRYQCTLSESIDNIEGALDKGSWSDWFEITQNPANNPYGAYLEAQIELDKRIASRVGLEDKQLSWNSGFLSWSECTKWEELHGPTQDGEPLRGACLERAPVQTPGATIKAGLDNVLPTELEKLISAERLDQVVGAVAVGLLRKFVFSDDGLFSSNTSANLNSPSGLSGAPLTINDVPGADECALLTSIGMPCNYTLVTASGTGFGTGTGTGGPWINGCPAGYESYGGACVPTGSVGTNDPCPTSSGYVYNPSTGMCTFVGTDGSGGNVPNNYGCVGSGCAPCSGADCGIGETEYGDPTINGVYAGSCNISLCWTSVRMTPTQCSLVKDAAIDINGGPGANLADYVAGIAAVCGGNGGSCISNTVCGGPGQGCTSVPGPVYICGFP